ncbi:MAG: hypothetical protein AAFR56_01335 [Chloroflexota bacterium]
MAQQRQPDAQLQWDVYIGSGNREADMAARLRKDLPRAGLRVHPAQAFHPRHMGEVSCVLALQAARKPDDAVRAAIAAAQHPDVDRPIVTVYVRDKTLAVQRMGNDPLYLPYTDGITQVVFAVWRVLEWEQAALQADMPASDSFTWLLNTLKP